MGAMMGGRSVGSSLPSPSMNAITWHSGVAQRAPTRQAAPYPERGSITTCAPASRARATVLDKRRERSSPAGRRKGDIRIERELAGDRGEIARHIAEEAAAEIFGLFGRQERRQAGLDTSGVWRFRHDGDRTARPSVNDIAGVVHFTPLAETRRCPFVQTPENQL